MVRLTVNVIIPSIRNNHRHPAQPKTPRRRNNAKANRDVTTPVADKVVQK